MMEQIQIICTWICGVGLWLTVGIIGTTVLNKELNQEKFEDAELSIWGPLLLIFSFFVYFLGWLDFLRGGDE